MIGEKVRMLIFISSHKEERNIARKLRGEVKTRSMEFCTPNEMIAVSEKESKLEFVLNW